MLRMACRSRRNWRAEKSVWRSLPRRAPSSSGKKAGGRTPAPPLEGPQPKDQINLTDEESRIMRVAGGGFEQCYNAQAMVAAESLLVIAVDVVQAPNDKQQIAPMLEKVDALPEVDRGPASGSTRLVERRSNGAAIVGWAARVPFSVRPTTHLPCNAVIGAASAMRAHLRLSIPVIRRRCVCSSGSFRRLIGSAKCSARSRGKARAVPRA
jgi:hypothetical protein